MGEMGDPVRRLEGALVRCAMSMFGEERTMVTA